MRREEAIAVIEALFVGWYPTLVRYANRLTGHEEFAEDAVQDVLVRLFEELTAGRAVEKPRAWTLVVLRRDIGKRWKKHRPTTSIEDLPELPAVEPTPGDDIAHLLAVLTPREGEVLLLRLEGLKYQEIARELGISLNTVGTLLVRSMRKLREALKPAPPPVPKQERAEIKPGRSSEPLQ